MNTIKAPHIGGRTIKTILSATIIAVIYSFFDRSACFACIGAVFGMGNRFQTGLKAGGNRFVGTLIGGVVSLPFYLLYHKFDTVIPQWLYLSFGLLLLTLLCQYFHAASSIQPAAVVFFVVIYTVADPVHFSYVIARILDTGIGVALSLFISWISPSPLDAQDRADHALVEHGKALLREERDLDSMREYRDYLRSELSRLEPLLAEVQDIDRVRSELEQLEPLIDEMEKES